jgi:hypothetical protein
MFEYLIPTKNLLSDALQALGSPDVIEYAEDMKIILSQFPLKPKTERGTNRQWTR